MRPTLGVVMLARDEGATLAGSIRSIAGIAEQVVVGVDARSTDDTATIAADLGALVVPVDFRGDFAAAMNGLDARLQTSWALKLDGHEQISDAAALAEALVDDRSATGAIALRVALGPEDGGARALALRVWRREPGWRFVGPIHEQLVGPSAFWPRPDLVLVHARPASVAARRLTQRLADDVAVLEGVLAAEPSDVAARYHLAGLYRERGERDRALAVLAGGQPWPAARPIFLALRESLWARLLLEAGEARSALRRVELARGAMWNVPELWWLSADVHAALGDRALAAACRRVALALPESPWEWPWDPRSRRAWVAASP